jgi:hypothetical protein
VNVAIAAKNLKGNVAVAVTSDADIVFTGILSAVRMVVATFSCMMFLLFVSPCLFLNRQRNSG